MSVEAALQRAASQPGDSDALAELASAALAEGEEERALPLLRQAVRHGAPAQLWQWKGLLERALDDHAAALESFAHASRRDPRDVSIAHGHARVALEAGLPAEALYEAALALAPTNGELLLGRAAARLAAGHGEQAEREVAGLLADAPLWIAGHMQLAQLRSMLGRPAEATRSIEEAIRRHPAQAQLRTALFDLHVKRESYAALDEAIRQAAGPQSPAFLQYEAIAAAELGQAERADALFETLPASALPIWRVRHFLRTGRAERALPLIDAELASDRAAEAWPYAALAWRLTGDPRAEWLDAGGRLVSVIDLGLDAAMLASLAGKLRALHVATGEYLDQSVRGGTQTDGPLFSRIDPEIRALRSAVVSAVERYVAGLPAPDARHPSLSQRRDRRIRFAGSWSVRLRGAGHHAAHVHPQGWISSALYIALPDLGSCGDERAGWLELGTAPPDLRLDLPAEGAIKPEPGKLILFPSWMWHGTVPFPAGERLTVAFDVAAPR